MSQKANNPVVHIDIREVDAWYYGVDEGWTYNQTFHICSIKTKANNIGQAILRTLKKRNIRFKKGTIRVDESTWNIVEIQNRKTGEPLYCGIISEVTE